MSKKKDPKDLLKEGRKPFYDDPKVLEERIKEYFISGCRVKKVYVKVSDKEYEAQEVPVPTITGLALFLGFVNRASMYDYQDKPEFTNTIKKAVALIENEYEELLRNGNCTGAIFALKNFGRKDKSEHETYGKGGGAIQLEITSYDEMSSKQIQDEIKKQMGI